MTAALKSMSFEVPGLPVPWMRAQKRGKRHFTAPGMAAHKERVAYAFQAARAPAWRLDGKYELTLEFWLPDYAVRDWDNLAKLVSDALNKLAWNDDNQVMRATVEKYIDPAWSSRTYVTIERIGDWPARRKARRA